MKKIRTLVIILFVVAQAICVHTFAQPRKLFVKGTFVHPTTLTEFPATFGIYGREAVYRFDKEKQNIGAVYKNGLTALSVYVYPAGDGTEGRLRREYLRSMQEMASLSRKGLEAEQGYKYFKKDGFKVNGFSATIDSHPNSRLTVFECGQWFFKIRITSASLDSDQINELEEDVLDSFDPTHLVRISRLNLKATIHFARAAFRDSLMLGSAMGSAFKEVEWVNRNVDSLERMAGFPDMYLQLHVEALKEFVQFEKRQVWERQQSTTDYLDELNEIIRSGYLEEFILDQFSMVMIVPPDLKLNFDGFEKWRSDHPTTINLNQRYYVISFAEPK